MSLEQQKRRFFIALSIPDDAKQELATIQSKIMQSLPTSARKIAIENLHITMRFIGDLKAPALSDLKVKLHKIALPSVHVLLNVLEHKSQSPRRGLIWAKGKETPEFLQLKNLVDTCVDEHVGVKKFLPHVTLFRMKSANKLRVKKLLHDCIFSPIDFIADSMSLMESHQSSRGVEYKEIERFDLSEYFR